MRRILFLLMIGIFACVSCGDDLDGDWDPMKWRVPKEMKKNILEVPSIGGIYTLECKNYKGFWLSDIYENDQLVGSPSDLRLKEGQWSVVKVEKNMMIVSIAPNMTDSARTLVVHPTAGDIFDTFAFKQAAP